LNSKKEAEGRLQFKQYEGKLTILVTQIPLKMLNTNLGKGYLKHSNGSIHHCTKSGSARRRETAV